MRAGSPTLTGVSTTEGTAGTAASDGVDKAGAKIGESEGAGNSKGFKLNGGIPTSGGASGTVGGDVSGGNIGGMSGVVAGTDEGTLEF